MFEDDKKKRIPIISDDAQPAPTQEAVPEPQQADATGEQGQLTAAQELDLLQAQLEEERDAHLRALAELQNYRRRVQQEREQALKYACVPVLTDLIPVLDHFEMATAAGDEAGEETRIFCRGYEMILQQLREALARHGLEEIPAVEGMYFDPEYHEAVERVPTEEECEGTVVRILQKGYKAHDRVLRPVRVAVAVKAD